MALGSQQPTTPIEPFASYTVGRARREFANQSRHWSDDDGDQPQRRRRTEPDARAGEFSVIRAASTGDLRLLQKRYAVAGYWAGSHDQRHRSGDRPAPGEQRPQLSAAGRHARRVRSDPDDAQRTRRDSWHFERSPATSVRFELEHRLQDRRDSTATTSGFIRRADEISQSNWLQWRHDKPGKYMRSFRFNINEWAQLQLRRRPPEPRRQRQRALDVQEQLEHRLRRQPRARQLRRSRHARRARRPTTTPAGASGAT